MTPDDITRAIFLRGHLRLVSCGMKGRTPKGELLKMATEITGVTYKRGQYGEAVADLCEFIDTGLGQA